MAERDRIRLCVGVEGVPFVCDACGVRRPGLPIMVGAGQFCVVCLGAVVDEVWDGIGESQRTREAVRAAYWEQFRAARRLEAREALLVALRSAPVPLTTRMVDQVTPGAHRWAREAMAELVAEGAVSVRLRRRARLHVLVNDPGSGVPTSGDGHDQEHEPGQEQ